MPSKWQLSSNWRSNSDHRENSGNPMTLPTQSSPCNRVEDKVPLRKRVCELFIAAYNGKHTEYLHSDKPNKRHRLFDKDYCTLLISTSRGSQLLIPPAEFTRYKYRPFSQDPSIEVSFGEKVYNPDRGEDEFVSLASLEIHADQLAAPVVRKFLPEVTLSSFREALKGTVGGITNGDAEIESVLANLRTPCGENGVNCMTLAISKGEVWIRYPQPQSQTPCSLAVSLQSQLLEIEYVTVIRRAEKNTLDIGDRLWDCMMERCLRDGIYWAYGQPKNEAANLNELQKGEIAGVPLRVQVARGELAAPVVSWCTWTEEKWRRIVDRARMIEIERTAWDMEKSVARMKIFAGERWMSGVERAAREMEKSVARMRKLAEDSRMLDM